MTSHHDLILERTPSAESALAEADAQIPGDYRMILDIIQGKTHSDVIRGRLRQFPDSLLDDWLAELQEAGLVSVVEAEAQQDLDFSALDFSAPDGNAAPAQTDHPGVRSLAESAASALSREGVFLSPDRLANRKPLGKTPEEIKVLIVEDDPDQAALAELRVSMAGYGLQLVPNCRELVNAIRTAARPDVVLLDVMLPDGNGYDILAGFRRHPKLALLPVVMLTAFADQDDAMRGLSLGADGYVTKPYSKKILSDTIRAVLKHL